jgi:dihydrofolate reductase
LDQKTVTAPISLVVARADNGVIGANGGLPWRLPDDLKRFKQLTLGKPCIMGRKTWDSLPKKPLPGRTNIVLTHRVDFAASGAVIVRSFDEALARAMQENPSEIMVIGGADIFAMALPLATCIHLTEVHTTPEGDVRMPAFAASQWQECSREDRSVPGGSAYSYVTLKHI